MSLHLKKNNFHPIFIKNCWEVKLEAVKKDKKKILPK